MSNVVVNWLREPWMAGGLVHTRPSAHGHSLASTSCGVASHSSWEPALQRSHASLVLKSYLPGGQPRLSLVTTHWPFATLLRKGHTLSRLLPSLL